MKLLEQWAVLPSYPDYEVSDLGRIRHSSGKPVPRRMCTYGYTYVKLNSTTMPAHQKMHVLVLTAFCGNRPAGQYACHINDIPDDNRLTNLTWGTSKLNGEHRVRNGNGIRKNLVTKRVPVYTKENKLSFRRVTTWRVLPNVPGYMHIPLVKPIPYLPAGWYE